MDEIEVPSFFICPISLQIMKDPVTIQTGITYDRDSIEQWLFHPGKHNTCPVTKQLLPDPYLTPNHTLRRLIQSWCTINTVERFPTPKPPVHGSQITKLISDARKSPAAQMKSLKRLKSIAFSNQTNRQCLEDAGAVQFLASIIKKKSDDSDEALSILHNLKVSETRLRYLASDGDFVASLVLTMQCGSCYSSRAYSVYLLQSMSEVSDPTLFICLGREFFSQLVQILADQISSKATKAALKLLVNVCGRAPRNRTKAIEANAVQVLVDFLVDSSEKRICEMVLVVLDQLCHCAEGRAELLKHGAGLAVVSKKILRVSEIASERAVRILVSVARFSGTSAVVNEMLQLGVVAKLCLVIQVDCGNGKVKDKAREILKMHGRVWRNSPCLPMNLVSSLPF